LIATVERIAVFAVVSMGAVGVAMGVAWFIGTSPLWAPPVGLAILLNRWRSR
jgi:hypothetical protein